jgi:uncharacterized protein (TIGR03435 family)
MPTRSFVFLLLTLPTLPAQVRFDAASVRPNRRAACSGPWDISTSHGTFTAVNAPLRRIISRAFELTDDRVAGPSWLDSTCYDIRATASSKTPDRDLMPMLRALLIERFHLVAQREESDRPIFALVIDKDGPKLRSYADAIDVPPSAYEGKTLFMVRHMPDLCERLGKVTGRPVIDKTGLTGDYQIVLIYTPLAFADAIDEPADVIAAVRAQLGLRLESQRATVEILKIQSIEKTPAAN